MFDCIDVTNSTRLNVSIIFSEAKVYLIQFSNSVNVSQKISAYVPVTHQCIYTGLICLLLSVRLAVHMSKVPKEFIFHRHRDRHLLLLPDERIESDNTLWFILFFSFLKRQSTCLAVQVISMMFK